VRHEIRYGNQVPGLAVVPATAPSAASAPPPAMAKQNTEHRPSGSFSLIALRSAECRQMPWFAVGVAADRRPKGASAAPGQSSACDPFRLSDELGGCKERSAALDSDEDDDHSEGRGRQGRTQR